MSKKTINLKGARLNNETDTKKGIESLESLFEVELPPEKPPTLFPFQDKGAEFLSKRFQALLADEMGLGKTCQVVKACDILKTKKILILCPAIARRVWLTEFQKFSHHKREFEVITSSKQKISGKTNAICSYDLAPNQIQTMKEKFDVLILDECHMLKSTRAFRAKKVFGRQGLVRQAIRVWAVSGTPAPNNAGELWLLFYTFGITNLSHDEFIQRYCFVTERRHTKYRCIEGTNPQMIPELRYLLSRFMLRRSKEDVMHELEQHRSGLPPIRFDPVTIEPSPVDLEITPSFFKYVYPFDKRDKLFDELFEAQNLVDQIVKRTGTTRDGMAALSALSSSLATLRRYHGVQKVEGIANLLTQELESNAYDKIVVFALHQDVIEGLRVKLSKFKPVTLYGKTPAAKRTRNIHTFQTDKRCRVFIGNILACGTAITLTAASNLLFAEQDWVPGNNAQAAMRVHRIGQTKPVFVRVATLPDSTDQKVEGRLLRKTKELTALFDGKKDLPSKVLFG